MLIASCGGNQRDRDPVTEGLLHPTAENIPVITDMRFVLAEDTSAADTGMLVREADFLQAAVSTIGINEGERQEMIGSILDVAAGDNTLFHLDGEYAEVRVYDQRGSLKQVVGSPGMAPGEFTYPEAVAVTGDASRFFVADQAGYRIQVFQRGGGIYELERTFLMPGEFTAGDICVMNGHVYATGYWEERDVVIHKITFAGEFIESFGQPYLADNLFVRSILSDDGYLACNEQNGVVVYVNQNVPVLKAYDGAGTLLWRVKFADHNPMHVVESRYDNGQPSVVYPSQMPGESSFIRLITDPITDSFIASYQTASPEGESPETVSRHYFSVPASTGHGSYLGEHNLGTERQIPRPPRIMALDEEYVYTARSFPFPEIVIYNRELVFE